DVTPASSLPDGLMGVYSDGIDEVSMPTGDQGSDWAAAAANLAAAGYTLGSWGTGTGGEDHSGDASSYYVLSSFFGSAGECGAVASSDPNALSDYTSLNQQAASLDQVSSSLESDYASLEAQSSALDAQFSSLEAQSGDLTTQFASLMTQSSSDQAQSSTDQSNYDTAQSQYATSQGLLGQMQGAMAQLNSSLDSLNSSGGDLLSTPATTPQLAANSYASYGGSSSASSGWNLGGDDYLQGGPATDDFAGLG